MGYVQDLRKIAGTIPLILVGAVVIIIDDLPDNIPKSHKEIINKYRTLLN